MEGRFDWGRYEFGTCRRRDVLTIGRSDCKAAEMGDSLATIDMGRKVGGGCCAPFREGSWVPI